MVKNLLEKAMHFKNGVKNNIQCCFMKVIHFLKLSFKNNHFLTLLHSLTKIISHLLLF